MPDQKISELDAAAALTGTELVDLVQSGDNVRSTVSDVGAVAVAAHVALSDPHTQYLTEAAATAGYQPLDSDLTAIAALTTTSFGRALLELANAGALLTAGGLTANGQSLVTAANYAAMRALLDLEAGTDFYSIAAANAAFQPLDSDLTAIAALTTTAYGRSVLELADAAALRTLAGLGSIATQASSNVTITGGSITGITDLEVADGGTAASTAINASLNLGYPYILGIGGAASSITGTTTETALGTVTVPAGSMGANGALRITTLWSYTNSANNKTIRVRLGGLSGTPFTSLVPTTTAGQRIQTQIHNRNATNSQVSWPAANATTWGTHTSTATTGAIDTTAAQDVAITGQLSNTGETITLEYYLVELIRHA